jgi:hypothetical protein
VKTVGVAGVMTAGMKVMMKKFGMTTDVDEAGIETSAELTEEVEIKTEMTVGMRMKMTDGRRTDGDEAEDVTEMTVEVITRHATDVTDAVMVHHHTDLHDIIIRVRGEFRG